MLFNRELYSLHFQGLLNKAVAQFERIKDWDYQAMYQLATMYYDGLGTDKDEVKLIQCDFFIKCCMTFSCRNILSCCLQRNKLSFMGNSFLLSSKN